MLIQKNNLYLHFFTTKIKIIGICTQFFENNEKKMYLNFIIQFKKKNESCLYTKT